MKKHINKARDKVKSLLSRFKKRRTPPPPPGFENRTPLPSLKTPKKNGFKERFKNTNWNFQKIRDSKYLDRIAKLQVEKMPRFEAILKQSSKLKLPFFFLLGLLLADLSLKGASHWLLGESTPKKAQRRQSSAPSKFYVKSKAHYDDIVRQNIFCPGCPVPDMKLIATTRPKDCGKAKPLRSSAKLIGTIVLSNPEYSVATIVDSNQTQALKRGERLGSYGTIFEIRRTRVCVENADGLLFYLTLPNVEVFQVEPSKVAASAGSGAKVISKGITQISDHEMQLDRSFVIEQTNNPNILYEAYATEYRVDGEVQGFRIHSINPGSSIEKLGFQPGDIILEVDGKAMDSVARAQELYASIGSTSDMAITIMRDGNRITKAYTVK